MKDLSIYCIGDSLVYGYGVRRAQCWTKLLSDMTGARVINCGVNGDTTAGMLSRLNAAILPEMKSGGGACCAVIMGGYNDIFFSGSDASARANIAAMTMTLRSEGVVPIVCIPGGIGRSGFPEQWAELTDFEEARRMIEDYSLWLEQYCRSFLIKHADMRPAFKSAGDGIFLDGIHPNPDGQVLIAKALAETITVWSVEFGVWS